MLLTAPLGSKKVSSKPGQKRIETAPFSPRIGREWEGGDIRFFFFKFQIKSREKSG